MIQSSATTTTPAAAPPPASSSSPSSSTAAAAVASSSICPICHCCIPHTAEFNQHINICLGLTPATTTAPANAAATTAPTTTDSGDAIVNVASSIASQMSLLHSLLSSHTTNSALLQQQDVQQQLRQLEQMYAQHQTQLHQLLIQTARGVTPFAAVAPVTSHSVPSSSSSITAAVDNSGMSDGEGKEEEEEKHVLSATDAAQSRKCSYPSLTPPDEGSSSSSNSRAPAVSNFKRHADDHASSSAAVHMYPSVSASSSSSSSSAAASSSSSFFPGDDDDAMVDDEAFVRRLQAEEDARAAAAVLQRKQREEAEFAEFLRREGSCASCGRTVPETETLESFLIPIGEERTNTTAAAAGETNSCEHKVCRDCLAQYLHQQMQRLQAPSSSSLAVPAKSLTEADLLCPVTGCRTRLSQWQMKRVLSAAEFETLLSYTLRNTLSSAAAAAGGTYVECPNSACKSVFLAEAGNEANIASISGELGIDGRPLSSAAKKHRAQNRFRCRECGTVFCGGCRHTPYHDGFDCEGYAAYVSGKKCRFCQTGLNASNTAPATMTQPQSTGAAAVLNNLIGSVSGFFGGSSSSSYAAAASSSPAAPVPAPPALLNVCNSAECLEKRASSCEKTLACGHNCCGIRGERQCLPCLEEECSFHKVADPGVTADDYCNICFTEGERTLSMMYTRASAVCTRAYAHVFVLSFPLSAFSRRHRSSTCDSAQMWTLLSFRLVSVTAAAAATALCAYAYTLTDAHSLCSFISFLPPCVFSSQHSYSH